MQGVEVHYQDSRWTFEGANTWHISDGALFINKKTGEGADANYEQMGTFAPGGWSCVHRVIAEDELKPGTDI